MKRIVSVVAGLALAAAPVAALAPQASATDRVTFNPVAINTIPAASLSQLTYQGAFACYTDIKHHTYKIDGKLVVWLSAKPYDGMCIQSVETRSYLVPATANLSVVPLKDAGIPIVEA